MGRQQAARGRQQQHQGVVGDLLGAVVGHVADDDAARPGRVDVHVVVADAAAHDPLAARQAGEGPLADLDGVEDEQHVGVGGALGHHVLVVGLQQLQVGHAGQHLRFGTRLGDGIGDDDQGTGRHREGFLVEENAAPHCKGWASSTI